MAAQWMGFTISIDCGPMGVFQGVVTAVEAEPQSVTLSRVFHNGVPHTSPSIVISAQDIKDLTIIAAPQAQLDPVVELKKPIPTRPERVGEGAQNFHSQPGPPRALHIHAPELEGRKAVGLFEFEQRILSSSAATVTQVDSLQSLLPGVLKLNAPPPSTSGINSQGATSKLNTAQTVSQRAHQLNTSQLFSEAASSQGGFKMTTALSTQAGNTLKSRQVPTAPSSNSKVANFSSPSRSQMNGLSQRSLTTNSADLLTLSSAAQALFRSANSQLSPQAASTLPRPQTTGTQFSPQKTSRGLSQNSLQVHVDGYASGSGEGNHTPNRRDRQRQRWQSRDEACFGSPSNNGFDEDFDFEKNLALFDKQAVYEQMAVQRPDLVLAGNDQRRQQNYRHDQNIIVNNRRIPTIIVPNPGSAEYVTDDGLIIPTMRPELLRQLHQKAHDVGFTFDRQSELFARCATEMSLQLLGGAHRLNPHNAHQWPTVVVMVGPHNQGSAGVTCARQLECQGVSTVTLVVNEAAAPSLMKRELTFYKCSGGPTVSCIDGLPDTVDLVIMALAGHMPTDVANSLEYGRATSWASSKRATVLALDPPPVGTPGIITKFALAPTLPVTYSPQNGKIYLCNLGVPIVVFKEMGIRYRSPFGSKFVIPLHPNDE